MIVLTSPVHWRHSERDGVLNHRRLECLFTVYSSADQGKHQRSTSLTAVTGNHLWWPVVSTHKGTVTRQMIPSDDVYMPATYSILWWQHDMETRSALLDICDGNPSVPSGFHSIIWSFVVFFGVSLINQQTSDLLMIRYAMSLLWSHHNAAGHVHH